MKTKFILVAMTMALISCGGGQKPKESTENASRDTAMHSQDTAMHSGSETTTKLDTTVIKDGQEVYFVNLKDGQSVKNPIKVKMGVKGMTVEPKGAINPDKGHHHIIVDGFPVPAGQVIPEDSTHIHFGKGQTETELTLTPGKHTLTLQFANGVHTSYGIRMSKTIVVNVAAK